MDTDAPVDEDAAAAPTAAAGGEGGEEAAAAGASVAAVRKVVVMYKAVGDAPILKQNKFKIDANEKFSKVVDFLRKQLRRDTLFVYLNSAFSPSLDERLSTLADSFAPDGKLVVNYALTPAWG